MSHCVGSRCRTDTIDVFVELMNEGDPSDVESAISLYSLLHGVAAYSADMKFIPGAWAVPAPLLAFYLYTHISGS